MSTKRSHRPLLKNTRNILITSALPYANNTPHLGNIIGCVLSADVYNRFCKARGLNTLFICGTDEYGTSTEFKAMEEDCSPREICDKYHQIHKDIYDWFEIDFDVFGRTSTQKQTEITQDIFHKLNENGHIEERVVKQCFCEKCDKFLADRYIEGTCPQCKLQGARGDQCDACGETYDETALIEPHCKSCGGQTLSVDSPNLFLRLPDFAERLSDWAAQAGRKWTENSVALTRAMVRGLQSRCVTRSLRWGTAVPAEGYEEKVFYVWFDAPIGYISITASAVENWEDWWKGGGAELCQFMGKDNIMFHSIMFPASLMGTGEPYTLVDRLCATEYLNYQGGKFSKSLGRGVFGDQARATGIPASVWRYYLLSIRPESSDSDFKWGEMVSVANGELINNFGNLVNRVVSFVCSAFDGVAPPLGALSAGDKEFVERVNSLYREYLESFEAVRITAAIRRAMEISSRANQLFHCNEPWLSAKGGAQSRARCGSVLNICLQAIHLLAGVLAPFMPSLAAQVDEQLRAERFSLARERFSLGTRFDGHRVGPPRILLERIPQELAQTFEQRFSGQKSRDFPLDLLVGEVRHIAQHPNADFLWVLTVKLGEAFEKKIVSSLKKDYAEAELLGRKVVVLNNVKKSKLKGVHSYGMVLCGLKEGERRVVTCQAGVGERVLPSDGRKCVVSKNFKYKKSWAELRLAANAQSLCLVEDTLLKAGGELLVVDGAFGECDLV